MKFTVCVFCGRNILLKKSFMFLLSWHIKFIYKVASEAPVDCALKTFYKFQMVASSLIQLLICLVLFSLVLLLKVLQKCVVSVVSSVVKVLTREHRTLSR